MEYPTFKALVLTVMDDSIIDRHHNYINSLIVGRLCEEYPDSSGVIHEFCYSTTPKTHFYVDGVQYKDTIRNLWKECEGTLY